MLGERAKASTIANAARIGAVGGWVRDALAVRGSGVAEVAGNTVRNCFAVETVLTSSKKGKKSLLYSLDSKWKLISNHTQRKEGLRHKLLKTECRQLSSAFDLL